MDLEPWDTNDAFKPGSGRFGWGLCPVSAAAHLPKGQHMDPSEVPTMVCYFDNNHNDWRCRLKGPGDPIAIAKSLHDLMRFIGQITIEQGREDVIHVRIGTNGGTRLLFGRKGKDDHADIDAQRG